MDGGALLNQAVHSVDLMTWLLGAPDEVFCWTARLAHERIDVEDTAVATVRFPSGALGVVHATTAAYPGSGVRIQVHGDKGCAVLDQDRLVTLTTSDGSVNDNVAVPATPVDAFASQYEDFIAAAGEHRAPLVDVADGAQTLAVIQAMHDSAAVGRPCPVQKMTSSARCGPATRSCTRRRHCDGPEWT
jgi:UDP-N-acetyl-2-amino-2-deoxyglucuronate dehydrogenase